MHGYQAFPCPRPAAAGTSGRWLMTLLGADKELEVLPEEHETWEQAQDRADCLNAVQSVLGS